MTEREVSFLEIKEDLRMHGADSFLVIQRIVSLAAD